MPVTPPATTLKASNCNILITSNSTELEIKQEMQTNPRKSKCRICKSQYDKRSMAHIVCGPKCAADYAIGKREKEDRKATKEKLQKLKPLSYWEERAQKACNEYVRLRDENEPCISCGSHTSYPRWQAGHFISVGANSTLRYTPENIHKQCVHCNMHKGGNVIEYRKRLTLKIGVDRVEWLESWHSPIKRTIPEVQAIEDEFKAKIKALKERLSLFSANTAKTPAPC